MAERDPIETLRALLSEATPGPWEANAGYVDEPGKDGREIARLSNVGASNRAAHANARAIAALRNLAPELLAVVEAAANEPRTNADGEVTSLACALDALRYTITPRPALLDVVITIEGGPTLHVSQPGVRDAALTAEAERIAALLDSHPRLVCDACGYEPDACRAVEGARCWRCGDAHAPPYDGTYVRRGES